MGKLNSFHRRVVRHMTGDHIRKMGEDKWEYPDHHKLFMKCNLFPMEVYLERRRGTLWEYLNKNKKELVDRMQNLGNKNRGNKKSLWWDQKFLSKKDMEKTNLWFPKNLDSKS